MEHIAKKSLYVFSIRPVAILSNISFTGSRHTLLPGRRIGAELDGRAIRGQCVGVCAICPNAIAYIQLPRESTVTRQQGGLVIYIYTTNTQRVYTTQQPVEG